MEKSTCATAFGARADRDLIDLYPDPLQAYLTRKSFALQKDQARSCDSSGYVLISYQNTILVVEFYEQNQQVVASLFAKSRVSM